MNDDGIRQLRSAVILQAVKDYRSARRKLANPKTKGNSRIQAERDLKECERFFCQTGLIFGPTVMTGNGC